MSKVIHYKDSVVLYMDYHKVAVLYTLGNAIAL